MYPDSNLEDHLYIHYTYTSVGNRRSFSVAKSLYKFPPQEPGDPKAPSRTSHNPPSYDKCGQGPVTSSIAREIQPPTQVCKEIDRLKPK